MLASGHVLVSNDFNCSFGNLEGSSDVTGVLSDFLGNQSDRSAIKDEGVFDSRLQDLLNLHTCVRLVDQTGVTDSTGDLGLKKLGQILSVSD